MRHKTLFSTLSCQKVIYRFTSSFDKFRFEDFSKEMAKRTGGPFNGEKNFGLKFVAPTRNPKNGYHVHFSCSLQRRRFRASLEYVEGVEIPDVHETRPFAEELMKWIGQFFRGEQVTADVDGEFSYLSKQFEPVLPMPMRLPLSRKREVEVTAMSVFVPARPQGIYMAFVGLSDEVDVNLSAERIVKFKKFDVRNDLLPLSSVARLFVREITK